MKGRKCLFLINVTEHDDPSLDRHGANRDEYEIQQMFEKVHGFILSGHYSGYVDQDDVRDDFEKFLRGDLKDIKMIAFVFMAHGYEDDW